MKKILFLLLFFINFSYAESIFITPTASYCISKYRLNANKKTVVLSLSDGTTLNLDVSSPAFSPYSIEEGFSLNASKLCEKNYISKLGMTENDYNFLHGLLGLLLGSFFCFGLFTIFSRK